MLGRGNLGRRETHSSARASAGLLLEDLPELEALIGGYALVLATGNTISWEGRGSSLPAVASI